MKIYKDYEITKVDYGYFEAVSILDCDAYILYDKNLESLKTQIDEL